MADRQLTYKVIIDTASARRSAQSIRSTIEAELRQIKMGQINVSSITAATNEAQRLRHELEQAGRAAQQVQVPSAKSSVGTGTAGGGISAGGGLETLAGGVLGGFAAGAVINQLQQVGQALEDLGRRGAVFGQINDVLQTYAQSVGTTGDAIVDAAKKAAQGTISEYELILNANRAIQFEVAKTPEAYAKLIELSTALGRAQGISDTQALEYLTTGLARESRLILDNLGLIIDLDAATTQYAATLGKTKDQLTTDERKQALLDEAFRQGSVAIEANRNAADSAATQFERFDANVQDLKDNLGKLIAEASADKIGAIADAIRWLNDVTKGKGDLPEWTVGLGKALEEYGKELSHSTPQTAAAGVALEYYGRMIQGLDESTRASLAPITDHADAIMGLGVAANDAEAKVKALENAEKAERQAAAGRADGINAQQGTINKALDSTAAKNVDTLGLEKTLQLLKQEKALVDQAVTDLINSSIQDPAEISLRLAEIQSAAQQVFTDMAAAVPEIDPGITAGSFAIITQSLGDLNSAYVDLLPSMSAARDELITLQTETALSGVVTDAQAASLDYLSAAAAAVSSETGLLTAVTNDLGIAFLTANPEATGLVDAMYAAQASYIAGQISAATYAGIIASLGGQLLTMASQAGVATGSILALVAAQGGLTGVSGFSAGQSAGDAYGARIKAQQDQQARKRALALSDAAAKQAESAAKRAAASGLRSANAAGKALEDGAKKAADELRGALSDVPGLFGASPVTQSQIDQGKAGVPQNFADDYLRRLKDEVFNKNDWADVSIEEAKAALQKVGISASGDAKIAFDQFAQAWESSVLFSDKANLDFINQEAVQLALDLKEKAKQGQANIYELFGVAVDSAVDAVAAGVGGGGGGGAGVVAPIPIPISATLERMPPVPVEVQPYFDPNVWSTVTMPPAQAGPVQPQVFGPQTKPGALGGTLAPTLDVAAIQTQLDALTLPAFTVTAMGLAELKTQVEATKISIPVNVYATLETMQDMATIVEMTTISLTPLFVATPTNLSELALAVETQAQISIPVGLYSTLETMQDLATIVEMTKITIPVAFGSGVEGVDLAMGLAMQLNTQFQTNANFFYAAGMLPAANVLSGYKGGITTSGDDLILPMVQSINTGIRSNTENLRNQGITMAGYVQVGFTQAFNGETFKAAIIAAGEVMAGYLTTGILRGINGGAIADAIGAKVLADLTAEVEKP